MERTEQQLREYDRGLLRSGVISLFWGVINERKRTGGYKLQALADALDVNKGLVSRWLSGDPNWRLNTLADVGNALNLDIEVRARDRTTGAEFTSAGRVVPTAVLSGTDRVPGHNQHTGTGAEVRVEAA